MLTVGNQKRSNCLIMEHNIHKFANDNQHIFKLKHLQASNIEKSSPQSSNILFLTVSSILLSSPIPIQNTRSKTSHSLSNNQVYQSSQNCKVFSKCPPPPTCPLQWYPLTPLAPAKGNHLPQQAKPAINSGILINFSSRICTFHSRGKCASCDPLLITNRQLIVSFLSKSCAKGKPLNPGISCVQQMLAPLSPHSLARKASRPVIHIHWGCSTPPHHRYTPHASKGGGNQGPLPWEA